jgi:hypothetical protein
VGEEEVSRKKSLTPAEHVELGLLLKRARRLLLDAAQLSRGHPTISQGLFDAANALTVQRSFLETRLMEQGASRDEARDCYFGPEQMEEVDA